MTPPDQAIRIGVIGTGFIARRLFDSARLMADLEVTRALTRRPFESCEDVGNDIRLTHSMAEVIEHADVIVECSGDAVHAAEVVRDAFDANLPVVTMNSEFHVTCGSHFVGKGYLTEARGDQPGCLAALRQEVVGMGFEPLVYGNMKGFLNPDPPHEDMLYWSERQGFRLEQTTSFTDGTKVQIEQAFVANAFGAKIAKPGLLAPNAEDFDAAVKLLGDTAVELGGAIADFTVGGGQPPGVFIVATMHESQRPVLGALKMGDGPYYTLVRPYHLCALEIPNTIREVVAGAAPLLDNSTRPTVSAAAVAKKTLRPGDEIEMGIGSFQVRASAVRIADEPEHVPIGLLKNAKLTKFVEPGQMLHLNDVDLPDTYARDIALQILRQAARH